MDGWPVRNFYSCGCYVADDVSIISRCAQHNGWVVARTSWRVERPRQIEGKNTKIIHHNLYDVLPRLKRKVDLVFAYPEADLFSVQQQLSPRGWSHSRMEIFEHIQRLLKPDGKAVFIVDCDHAASAIYQAKLHGFEVHTRFAPVMIKAEPLWAKQPNLEQDKVYKMVVGLNTGPLPRFRLSEAAGFFDGLDIADDARILDTSCILLDVLREARPDAQIMGIIENATRYQRIVEASRRKP
jgi:hypothetical protein